MAKKSPELIVGLDIGTSKISCVIGEVQSEGGVGIIGVGTSPSTGLQRGVVVNIEKTKNAIRQAVESAGQMAGCEVHSVFTGIAGGHIQGRNSEGMISLNSRPNDHSLREVSSDDIQRVIDCARTNQQIPVDREIIHVIPQEYFVDDQGGIKDPHGMAGTLLKTRVHIVTCALSAARNITKCVTETGLDVEGIVLQPLASAEACLTEDEREMGVCLVDIGCGTTDISIFSGGSIVHTAVIALGGATLTNDIVLCLRTPADAAEKMKTKYGCALASLVDDEEQIEVPSPNGKADPRIIKRKMLCEIIQPRAEEIFQMVQREIQKCQCEDLLPSGIVITGGSSKLQGITEVAESVLNLPVRLGEPRDVGGLTDLVRDPSLATGVGLVLHGARTLENANRYSTLNGSSQSDDESLFQRFIDTLRQWF